MKRRVPLTICLALVLLAAFSPRHALAQALNVEQLIARVAELERRVAELEQRLRAIEGTQTAARPASRRLAGNSRDVANWRQLQEGMTMDQVSVLLGQPERVSANSIFVMWYYPSRGSVSFNPRSQKVQGWEEPSR